MDTTDSNETTDSRSLELKDNILLLELEKDYFFSEKDKIRLLGKKSFDKITHLRRAEYFRSEIIELLLRGYPIRDMYRYLNKIDDKLIRKVLPRKPRLSAQEATQISKLLSKGILEITPRTNQTIVGQILGDGGVFGKKKYNSPQKYHEIRNSIDFFLSLRNYERRINKNVFDDYIKAINTLKIAKTANFRINCELLSEK